MNTHNPTQAAARLQDLMAITIDPDDTNKEIQAF